MALFMLAQTRVDFFYPPTIEYFNIWVVTAACLAMRSPVVFLLSYCFSTPHACHWRLTSVPLLWRGLLLVPTLNAFELRFGWFTTFFHSNQFGFVLTLQDKGLRASQAT